MTFLLHSFIPTSQCHKIYVFVVTFMTKLVNKNLINIVLKLANQLACKCQRFEILMDNHQNEKFDNVVSKNNADGY